MLRNMLTNIPPEIDALMSLDRETTEDEHAKVWAFLSTQPRNEMGDVICNRRDKSEDGTTIEVIWNEIDGFRIAMFNDDFEYLQAKMRNLFPNTPERIQRPN